MTKVSMDFETRSNVDLTTAGMYRYAADPSTGVYCLAWAIDDMDPVIWIPDEEEPPESLIAAIDNRDEVWAFNAAFERLIWNNIIYRDFDVPYLEIEQTRCTAAQGRVSNLPDSLYDQARCLGLHINKHDEGWRLIKTYSINNVPWKQIPKQDQELWIEYCLTDVEVERLMQKATRPLTDLEWYDNHIIEEINDRGVPVDVEFAAAAVPLAQQVKDTVNEKILQLTGGKVEKSTSRKARDAWMVPRLNEEQRKLLMPEGKIIFDKAIRANLLARNDLDPVIRDFTELVDEAGGSTLTKYQTILDSHINGRVHGVFMYAGGHTGRQSSRLLQLQNLRRDVFNPEDAEQLMEDIINGVSINDIAETLAKLIRPTIYSDKQLTVFDWKGIEARILAWLAGNTEELNLIINGADLYKRLASVIVHKPIEEITKEERHLGKTGVLACGYSGGVKAITGMSTSLGKNIDEVTAMKIRDAYRNTHPKEVRLWTDLLTAIRNATRNPGTEYQAADGKISYEHDGKNLWLRLPSGRFMVYREARLELVDPPWEGEKILAVTYSNGKIKPKAGQKTWPRSQLGPNTATENICQAIGADILREALRACHQQQLPVIMSIHDEIIIEEDHVDTLSAIMQHIPSWAEGLPLDIDGYLSYAFSK